MFSANLIKGLIVSSVFFFLVACGGAAKTTESGGGRSTAPTEEQIQRMNTTAAEAEAAENAYFETKNQRIELERQLEDQQ